MPNIKREKKQRTQNTAQDNDNKCDKHKKGKKKQHNQKDAKDNQKATSKNNTNKKQHINTKQTGIKTMLKISKGRRNNILKRRQQIINKCKQKKQKQRDQQKANDMQTM